MEVFAAQFNAAGLILGDVTRDHLDVEASYSVDMEASDDDHLVADVRLIGPRVILAWTLLRLWRRYGAHSRQRRWKGNTFQARTTFHRLGRVSQHPFYLVVRKHRELARMAEFRFGSGMCTVQFGFDAGTLDGERLLADLRDAVAAARLTAVVRQVTPSAPIQPTLDAT